MALGMGLVLLFPGPGKSVSPYAATSLVTRWKGKGMVAKDNPVLYTSPFICVNLKIG